MKTALAVVLLLAAAAAVGMGFMAAPASAQTLRIVPAVVMRALPTSAAAKVEVPAASPEARPADSKPAEAKPAAVEAKPAAEAKPAETKPAETKPAEAKPAVEAKPAEAKPAVEAKPAEAKPAPKPAEPKPAPVAKPPPAAKPPPSADGVTPATGGAAPYGQFNLRASDTADVFVDGKKVGGSPVLGLKVKPGKHKIRFDCYDASGDARPGVSTTHEVAVDGEKDIEFDCE